MILLSKWGFCSSQWGSVFKPITGQGKGEDWWQRMLKGAELLKEHKKKKSIFDFLLLLNIYSVCPVLITPHLDVLRNGSNVQDVILLKKTTPLQWWKRNKTLTGGVTEKLPGRKSDIASCFNRPILNISSLSEVRDRTPLTASILDVQNICILWEVSQYDWSFPEAGRGSFLLRFLVNISTKELIHSHLSGSDSFSYRTPAMTCLLSQICHLSVALRAAFFSV